MFEKYFNCKKTVIYLFKIYPSYIRDTINYKNIYTLKKFYILTPGIKQNILFQCWNNKFYFFVPKITCGINVTEKNAYIQLKNILI